MSQANAKVENLRSNGPSQKSVYAFVGWITTIVIYVIFLIWAYTPDPILHSFGITYYPSRYFAIAIPAYVLVVYFLSVVLYIGMNMVNTPDPEELCNIRDQYTRYIPNTFHRYNARDGIPEIGDIDPRYVSKLLASAPIPGRK